MRLVLTVGACVATVAFVATCFVAGRCASGGGIDSPPLCVGVEIREVDQDAGEASFSELVVWDAALVDGSAEPADSDPWPVLWHLGEGNELSCLSHSLNRTGGRQLLTTPAHALRVGGMGKPRKGLGIGRLVAPEPPLEQQNTPDPWPTEPGRGCRTRRTVTDD